ncbi:MAG TPA: Lrp/AsnC ligand binding domain-containing protein [Tepidiformaceae bacterium]|nr:Lrp/AsnC ligand binding domain-containing protein [Tepidiformaceae bacterium]
MIRGWVLVQTEPGRARPICDALAGFHSGELRVITADTVTGPHDIIVHAEAPNVDALSNVVGAALGDAPGVEHITTCIAMD